MMDRDVMEAATRRIRVLIADEERGIIMAHERIKAFRDSINAVEGGIAAFEKTVKSKVTQHDP